jgi:hypothetical protein
MKITVNSTLINIFYRFRMKMKVTHGACVAVFVVFEEDVQKLAVETCPMMLNMVCN